jgi:biotin carboxyl carrier protein
MYSIIVDGNKKFKTKLNLENNLFEGTLNNLFVKGDFIKINNYQYHIILHEKSYTVDIIKLNIEEKKLLLKINSIKFDIELKDKYDELLHNLGLDDLAVKKINEIKAPMPGMVLSILINEGDVVKKGDSLLVLEAMKMENIIKSPADGTIKKIIAITGIAVEKNQLLIQFLP